MLSGVVAALLVATTPPAYADETSCEQDGSGDTTKCLACVNQWKTMGWRLEVAQYECGWGNEKNGKSNALNMKNLLAAANFLGLVTPPLGTAPYPYPCTNGQQLINGPQPPYCQ